MGAMLNRRQVSTGQLVAGGVALSTGAGWISPGAAIDFDLKNDRYFASGFGSFSSFAAAVAGGAATFSRLSVADWVNEAGTGLAPQAGNSVLRRDSRGALREPSIQNVLLNSLTPATQTRSLAAGNYTLQVFGSGSCALSGGPTGTATDGSPIAFTLGGTTSVTFTVSGSPFAFGCWIASSASVLLTSPVVTAGSSAARAVETLIAKGAITYPFTVVVVAREGLAYNSACLLTWGVSALEGLQIRRNSAANAIGIVKTVGGVNTAVALVSTGAFGARFALACRIAQGDQAASVNGGAPVTGTDAAMPTGALTDPNIGGSIAGAYGVGADWNNYVERVVLIAGGKTNAELQTLSTLAAWGG